jgi:Kef-type K+ transport system membrane component KefB
LPGNLFIEDAETIAIMMMQILKVNFTLPLTDPVIIFSLVLFIILFVPILLNKIRVPHIIGLIIAGVLIGPYGFNLLLRDSSIVLFGTVGLLYIMFTAGLEIDMEQFRKNRMKSFVFGLFTFVVPMIIGSCTAFYLLNFTFPASLLLGGMFASHTLLAYPIVRRYNITRIQSVTLTIGGTIIADLLALLVLATVTGMTKGNIGAAFWIRLTISTAIFGCIVLLLFPILSRWFFKRYEDSISQYTFVLASVFLGSFLAELAGLEAIIGAFTSGLAINRFIPHSSSLMNRIEFVGNAVFIPFFLISVGMLVDFTVLFKSLNALIIALVMTIIAVVSKYISAVVTQHTFRLSKLERQIIFGLSTARVGATLAIVLVGYNIIIGESLAGEPLRLISEDVLNGTVIMILCTCTMSSFVVEKASQQLALNQEILPTQGEDGKILISLAYPETVTELIDFGLMLKSKQTTPVYALNVVSEEGNDKKTTAMARKMMDRAINHAASMDQPVIPIMRYDINISNGIIYTLKEQNITDLLIGLHHEANSNNFLGSIAEGILKHTSETVFIYKAVQPLNTLKRIITVVAPQGELEPGFNHWFTKITTIAKQAGLGLAFYATDSTLNELKREHGHRGIDNRILYHRFDDWDDFLIFSREIKPDDLFVIVSSRKGHVSYQPALTKLPYYLSKYFTSTSFIMLYPQQLEKDINVENVQYVDGTIAQKIASVGKRKNLLGRLFGRK